MLRAASLLMVLFLCVGCSVNPATGKRSFTILSWDEEKKLGADAAPQFTQQFGGPVGSRRHNAYVSRVGASLIDVIETGVPDLEWEFTLLDSDVINAFALPGGKVFITKGLASQLSSEAELAGVLGHEVGHVTARHGNQRISKQTAFNVALAGAAIAVGVADADSDLRKYGQYGVPALAIGGNVVLLKYGRDEETEADMLGMRYMSKAGYDPIGQLYVMQVLAEAGGGGGRQPEFLSTHPYPETRIQRIRGLLASDYAHTKDNDKFRLYRTRYQTDFLDGLQKASGSSDPEARAIAALGNPVLWCGHCAEATP